MTHPNILCVSNFWTDVHCYQPTYPGERLPNGLLRFESAQAAHAAQRRVRLWHGACKGGGGLQHRRL